MKLNLFFIFLCSIILFNCSENFNKDTEESSTAEQRLQARAGTQPLVLGKQLENPFAIENMQQALTEILADSEENLAQAGIRKKSVENIVLDVTDLYVKMRATDSLSALDLQFDSTLTLFPFPLDYEIQQRGDYLPEEKNSKKEYPWYYTTVKPGYTPLQNVKMELLAELFIPEHSDLFTIEDVDSDEGSVNTSSVKPTMNKNFVNALLTKSFELTGNANQLSTTEESGIKSKASYTNCKTYRFLWVKWTSCDTYYNPEGYIKIHTNSNGMPVPLKGVKVRMWRWFYYGDAWTNSNGYFRHNGQWNKLLLGNDMDYHIIFEGNYHIRWTLEKGYPFAFWTQWYDAGKHSPDRFDLTFYTNSYYWGIGVQHTAIYDFITNAVTEGLSLPPNNLKISTGPTNDNDGITSSAPMLASHVDYTAVWASMIVMFPQIFLVTADLVLQYKNELEYYSSVRSNTIHEVAHAQHFQRIRKDKGFWGASNWWSALVFNETRHTAASFGKNYYGSKGDVGWEYIALAEGWANYREWRIEGSYPSSEKFEEQYAHMFNALYHIGCSNQIMERCLTATSVKEFREKLTSLYPSLKVSIDNIIIGQGYE